MAYVIDQAHCSCCHRCRVECPVQAIRFKGSKYWIDPEKCIGCGHCAEVCHNSVITDPEAPKPEVRPHEKIVKTCDVLVIGGGWHGCGGPGGGFRPESHPAGEEQGGGRQRLVCPHVPVPVVRLARGGGDPRSPGEAL